MVAHLKGTLSELYQAARERLFAQPAKSRFWGGQDWVAVRDANEFDPRGTHRVRTAVELLRLLRLSLASPPSLDSSRLVTQHDLRDLLPLAL